MSIKCEESLMLMFIVERELFLLQLESKYVRENF